MDDDVRAFVIRTAEEREIRFVRLWFTDILGFLKSFAIPAEELQEALTEGVGFDGSSIDGFARVQEADMVAHPDPSTFQILPWRPGMAGVARMFCDIRTPEGTLFEGDPRAVLRRAMSRASDLGLSFYVGSEIEFFLFGNSKTPEPLDVGTYFDLTPLDVGSDFRRRVIDYLEQFGVPVKDSHHAIAASQHEVDLRHTDALTMADSVMTFRLGGEGSGAGVGRVRHVHAEADPGRRRVQPAHPHVVVRGRSQRVLRSDRPLLPVEDGAFVRRRPAPPRARDQRGHEPVGELLQAAGAGVRGSALRVLGREQPLGPGARPAHEAGQGGRGADRVPSSRPGLQPVPGVRVDPHGGAARHRAGVRAAAPRRRTTSTR